MSPDPIGEGKVSRSTEENVKRVLTFLSKGLISHEDWAAYLKDGKEEPAYVGNLATHEWYIAEYRYARELVNSIERLLADEREKAKLEGEEFMWNLAHEPARCGHARANWKDPEWGTPAYKGHEKCEACQTIAVERENVKEMCIKELVVLSNQWEALTSGELDNDGVAACRSGIAAIRQLDLTQALAPSSAEKGGK